MSDLAAFSLRPSDVTDADIDALISKIREMRHTFNTTAKPASAPKAKAKPASEAQQTIMRLSAATDFDL